MYCPKCGAASNDAYRFCTHCGTDLHPEAGEVIYEKISEKKGSHWVPILILVVLSAIGIALFFATAGRNAPAAQSDTPWFSISNGELYYFDEALYPGPSDVTIPAEINGQRVTAIADGCFAYCSEISTVYLPDSLEYIGHYAFEGCTSLRGIYIPESVTEIGEMAFAGCTALEAVSIPESMTDIGFEAFSECNKLFYIFYPGSIDEWTALYDEFINPYTAVYCKEGSFFQGGSPFE